MLDDIAQSLDEAKGTAETVQEKLVNVANAEIGFTDLVPDNIAMHFVSWHMNISLNSYGSHYGEEGTIYIYLDSFLCNV